jgi:N utilization substance protein B
MGSRRRARELAFLALYQSDLLGEPAAVRLRELAPDPEVPAEAGEYARLVVDSFDHHRPAVDRTIRETAPQWELERMATTDRAVLRLAVVELLFMPGVPDPVTINEAIEIGKRYGGEGSGRFVNGVLDAIRRRITERIAEPLAAEPAEIPAEIPAGEPASEGGDRPPAANPPSEA